MWQPGETLLDQASSRLVSERLPVNFASDAIHARMSENILSDEAPATSRRRRSSRRWRWVGLAVLVIVTAAYSYSRGWKTQLLRLPDGRTYEVLNWDRHVSLILEPDGRRSAEHNFWMRYYSNAKGIDAMRREARDIAPFICHYADSLGYRTLQIDPAYPLLFRHFPIAVFSTPMRFVRDSAGHWQEEDS
jgi:hypothetical protein